MNYSKVQFISWELNTGPLKFKDPQPPFGLVGTYPGIKLNSPTDSRIDAHSQCVDIQARLAFTSNAMSQALKDADKGNDVLKVFMGPEFLFRGAGGAYLHDLLTGWTGAASPELGLAAPYNNKWAGLFGGLQSLAANDNYKNWIFVFGTALSGSFPTLKGTDGKYYLDPTKPGEGYNTALIQLGGAGNTAVNYASRKHYKSPIDYLKYTSGSDPIQFKDNTILPADPRTVIPADVLGVPEGGALFNLANVNDAAGKPLVFGIEVCLDHASSGNSTNDYGRIRTANQYVKIQLVPSGGMELEEASIRLLPATGPTTNSYAFNVDGLNGMTTGNGCHTQVWNGSNGTPVPPTSKLFEASNGEQLANTTVNKVAATIQLPDAGTINDTQLWKNGSGSVRIMKTLPL